MIGSVWSEYFEKVVIWDTLLLYLYFGRVKMAKNGLCSRTVGDFEVRSFAKTFVILRTSFQT